MPAKHKTNEKGVFYRFNKSEPDVKQFYIVFRMHGRMIEQRVGSEPDMTAEKAALYRSETLKGKLPLQRDVKRQQRKVIIKRRKMTIDLIWKRYKKERKQGKALKNDKYRYEKYIEPRFGNKVPTEISKTDVDKLRKKLLKKRSPQTTKHVLNILTQIINFGFENGLCPKLDFKVTKPKISNRKDDEYLTKDQMKKLLKTIKKDKNKNVGNMMLLALYSGMRRNEIFKLQWLDIDFENNWITVRNPKGGTDQQIPLNKLSRDLLKNHPKTKVSKYVFPGRDGKLRVTAQEASRRIRDDAGLPKSFRPFHGLRHSYASMLASSGKVTIFELQKLLTHKDIRMTERYSHLLDSALKKASNVTGHIVNSALMSESKKVKIRRRKKG